MVKAFKIYAKDSDTWTSERDSVFIQNIAVVNDDDAAWQKWLPSLNSRLSTSKSSLSDFLYEQQAY